MEVHASQKSLETLESLECTRAQLSYRQRSIGVQGSLETQEGKRSVQGAMVSLEAQESKECCKQRCARVHIARSK